MQYISLDHACMLTLASRLIATVAISLAMDSVTDKRSHARSPCDYVVVFLEQMNEAVRLLENVSEEQIVITRQT